MTHFSQDVDKFEGMQHRIDRSMEVEAFVRLRGLTREQAFDIVGLHPRHFYPVGRSLDWIPMPAEIQQQTEALKFGCRLDRWNATQHDTDDCEPLLAEFEADEVDDECPVLPPWLYAADRFIESLPLRSPAECS